MKKLAVIPARGGSKRIPRKNIRLFAGKPILAYSILAALKSDVFDQIIVSTDDEEIAEVARKWGAATPFLRPVTLADDYTGTNAVAKHALDWYSDQEGVQFDLACCIYATAPFVQPASLIEGCKKLTDSGQPFAFSVTSFPFPIQRAVCFNEGGLIEAFNPHYMSTRSQDLQEAYHDAGQFYWGRADAFRNDVSLFSAASVPVILPRYLVQDIDTLEDWQRAEFMYKALELSGELVT